MEYKNKMMTGKDMELKCTEIDCGEVFIFTIGEQQFFNERGLTHVPTRCRDCREKRRAKRDGDVKI